MVSGNDAANMLADMLGGQRVAVAAMNRKAASRRRPQHQGVVAVGARRAGLGVDHHAARPRGDLPRGPDLSADRADHAGADGGVPRQDDHRQNELLTRYPGTLAGKTGFTNLARDTFVAAAQRGNRRLVVVEMYGDGDLYGQAIGLFDWGFARPALPYDRAATQT